ncbi:MAG: 4Fe-4S dicluster domain-containing protein [Oligoflexus sp.]
MRSIDSDLQKLAEKKEVFIRDEGPFEAPAKTFVPGPYYQNIEEVLPELAEAPAGKNEADETSRPRLAVDRRDFMRLFSVGAFAASTACVRRPVEMVVPYVNSPNDQVPGQPVYYATTVDGVGVVVKTREGRPVFLEGNPEHPLSQGSATMFGMSELQALYHPDRRKGPEVRYGTNRVGSANWNEVYDRLATRLEGSKNIAILAKSTTGHTAKFYREFLVKLGQPESNLYFYEANTIRLNQAAAYRLAFGVEGLPRTDLRRTDFILGVGSEFLDMGIAHVYESKSWAASHTFQFGRKGRMVQFEARTTNTGAAANERYVIGPGDELAVTLMLVEALLANGESKGIQLEKDIIRRILEQNRNLVDEARERLSFRAGLFEELAKDLISRQSIVMVGESLANSANGTLVQLAGIMANLLSGAFEKNTLHFNRGWMNTGSGTDDIDRFLRDAENIDFLFVVDVNPAFTLPSSTGIKDKLRSIKSVASLQSMPCETDDYAEFRLNTHNVLETWGDEEFVAGFWSLTQPVVRPVTDSRQAEDIFLWTAARMNKAFGVREYREYVRQEWQALHKETGVQHDFETFFQAILRKGFYGKIESRTLPVMADVVKDFNPQPRPIELKPNQFMISAHLDARLIDGRGADRPVLQETGDSMTTVTWDTWVAISPQRVRELGLRYNEVVRVEGPAGSFEASVYPMPGLHPDTIAVPRGNGHTDGTLVSFGVGVDPLTVLAHERDTVNGLPVTYGQVVSIVATGRHFRLAALQKHNDIANRHDIYKKTTMSDAVSNMRKEIDLDEVPDLYPELPEHPQYRWGMSIDLDKCTGCSACSVACDLENNVAQVGREQVIMGREMHWLRIDRYFSGPVDNPTVNFQPRGCQHCNHAPCEGVCPVYATVHDEMGMNAQIYNRCVGTRYCANACPYKVRRYNWFTYKWGVMGARPMDRNPRALNPDVTVRTRGVMEKCTFCVQRIQSARHEAKLQDREVRDGEIKTACESACPTNAIVFGNLKDKTSRVARQRRDYRSFLMLGGDPAHGHYNLKTLPNVSYMAKVTLDQDYVASAQAPGETETPNYHE